MRMIYMLHRHTSPKRFERAIVRGEEDGAFYKVIVAERTLSSRRQWARDRREKSSYTSA